MCCPHAPLQTNHVFSFFMHFLFPNTLFDLFSPFISMCAWTQDHFDDLMQGQPHKNSARLYFSMQKEVFPVFNNFFKFVKLRVTGSNMPRPCQVTHVNGVRYSHMCHGEKWETLPWGLGTLTTSANTSPLSLSLSLSLTLSLFPH